MKRKSVEEADRPPKRPCKPTLHAFQVCGADATSIQAALAACAPRFQRAAYVLPDTDVVESKRCVDTMAGFSTRARPDSLSGFWDLLDCVVRCGASSTERIRLASQVISPTLRTCFGGGAPTSTAGLASRQTVQAVLNDVARVANARDVVVLVVGREGRHLIDCCDTHTVIFCAHSQTRVREFTSAVHQVLRNARSPPNVMLYGHSIGRLKETVFRCMLLRALGGHGVQ